MSKLYIPLSLQRRVRDRATDRCEYCRIAQVAQEATFHVDHVHPRKEGGLTRFDNLALACVSCSLRKGARTQQVDPSTGETVALFNPRKDAWNDHFEVTADLVIVGRTRIGAVTVEALRMNRPLALEIRREEAFRRRYP